MKINKILIVDDSLDNLQIIYSIIDEYLPKYKILQTNNPHNVLHIANTAEPNLIITDWDMPKLSGIELIELLKNNQKTKNIPIIMVTGVMLTTENLRIALDAGAVDYIRKPIEPLELIARINSAILLKDYYNQLMEQKDENLAKSTIELMKNQEFIKSLAKNLMDTLDILKTDLDIAQGKLDSMHKVVAAKLKEHSWDSFDSSFSKIHSNFSKNLIKLCANITPAEIRLCSLIKLGLSNKEIASVLNQLPDSIKVARYRIRKKIDIDRNVNFEIFLSEL